MVSSPPSPRNTSENNAAPMRMTKTMEVVWVVLRMVDSKTPSRQAVSRLAPTAATMTPHKASATPIARRSGVAILSRSSRRSNVLVSATTRMTESAPATISFLRSPSLCPANKIVPTAPTAAASVGVAMPASIEPSTEMMRKIGANSAPSRSDSTRSSSYSAGGAMEGLKIARPT